MADLEDVEIVVVAEIVEENYQATRYYCQHLTDGQIASLRLDLVTWGDIRDKHLKIKGGKDGVDLDNERKRAAIRRRLRLMLLLEDVGSVGIRMVRG
ncbi:MAG: hypothetical protein QOD00_1705 [Blastocatellia bacterium]|jgi:hypothetical protein|nr:hypothetical protein [Blastocatellia bacterium]